LAVSFALPVRKRPFACTYDTPYSPSVTRQKIIFWHILPEIWHHIASKYTNYFSRPPEKEDFGNYVESFIC
jgi:hypothetical protein